MMPPKNCRNGLAGCCQGGRFRGSHISGAHEQADADAGDAMGRNQAGREQGALLGLPIGLAGQNGLGIGLGREHTEKKGEAGADVLQRSSCGQAVKAGGEVSRCIDVGEGDCGLDIAKVCADQNALEGGTKTGQAASHVQHGDKARDRGDVEKDQLQDAAHAGADGTAKEHIDRHQDGHDDHRCRSADAGEQNAHEACAGDHLCEDADEDADGAEGRADRLHLLSVLPADDLKLSGAAALADGICKEEGKKQAPDAGTQSEPPGKETVGEGQLCGADGRLRGDQGTHDAAAHQEASAPAASSCKVSASGDLFPGVETDADDEGEGDRNACDL